MPHLLAIRPRAPFRAPFRRLGLVAGAVTLLAGCGDDGPTAPDSIAGSYRATEFRVTPTGEPTRDVLGAGGSLTLTIAADNTTTGVLTIPASLNEGVAFTERLDGRATRTGNTVVFEQASDTFVRDLAWTASGNTLRVTDQDAGGARFRITLTRQ